MPNDMKDMLIGIVKSSLIKHIDKSCNLAENIVDDLLAENLTVLPVAFSDNRRERMIELLEGYYEETAIGCVLYFTEKESEMLADYILADGWIRPPCKVGDTVYIPWKYDGLTGIAFFEVTHIIIDRNKSYIKTNFATDDEGFYELYNGGEFVFDDFGKTVFLTREEAEQALKEGADNA